jgi:hypothetical protein
LFYCMGEDGKVYMKNVAWPELLQHATCSTSSSGQHSATNKRGREGQPNKQPTMAGKTPPLPTNKGHHMPAARSSHTTNHPAHNPSMFPHRTSWVWGDGHCFYYAVAIQINMLSEWDVWVVQHTKAAPHTSTSTCHAPEAKLMATSIEHHVPSHILRQCACQERTAILAHRDVATMLRNHVQSQMRHLQEYFQVLEGGPAFKYLLEQRIEAAATAVVHNTIGYAGDPEIRSMACHLQRDIIVLHPTETRLYSQHTPPLAEARQSMEEVGYLQAVQGHGRLGWYFQQMDRAAIGHHLQQNPNAITLHYNGRDHFENVVPV